jgi:RNA polymerase sigma factor (sigma-70 family)
MSEDAAHDSLGPSGGHDNVGEVVRRIQAYLDQLRQRGAPLPANREEWERFFRLHAPFLLRLVRSRHWSMEDCEDGVQELWLLLITRLPNLRYDPCRGEIRNWISTVAKHWLMDQDRYRRTRSMKRLGSKTVDQLAGREPDPVAAAERIQLTERVHEALAELRMCVSQRDYEAFTLHWLTGLSVKEVAQRLGRTEAQIWSSHHRMSCKLRPLLARRLEPGSQVDR